MACVVAVTVDAPPSYPGCFSAADAASCEPGGPLAKALTTVERSLLRALAFVLHQLHRDHARHCATSVAQWYLLLQSQLPGFAAEPLERAAASVSALADASFTDFWLSLLSPETSTECSLQGSSARQRKRSLEPLTGEADAKAAEDGQGQQHVLARLYEYITRSILGFFADQSPSTDGKQRRSLTPCTSPVSSTAELSPRLRRRRFPSTDDSDDERGYWSHDAWKDDETNASTDYESDSLEPGWAVEYMQQELALPSAMKRRMVSMMHSTVPLNLFRATVAYPSTDEDTYGEDDDDDRSSSCASERGRGFVGAVTPGSLPPTPITRDLQARRMHRYTVFVLDQTTHALQLLDTHRFES